MSATLAWNISANGVKTGTTATAQIDDLDTLIATNAADPTFFWEKAGKNTAAAPYWLLLRPKSGANGRIALIMHTGSPAAVQPVLYDATPSLNQLHVAYFPNGTGTTLSNLTTNTGTVCGNDTNAVKANGIVTFASSYTTGYVPYYGDCAEGMVFCYQLPSNAAGYWMGAGELLIDQADVAYGCTFGTGTLTTAAWGNNTGPTWGWLISQTTAIGGNGLKTNYGSTNRSYYDAWNSQPWTLIAVGPNDPLSDTTINKSWFVAKQLLAPTAAVRGEGMVLKFRQIVFGHNTIGAFTKEYLTGPVLMAMQVSNCTTGSTGVPWLVNYKL